MRLLFTVTMMLWGTSAAAQPQLEYRFFDPHSAFSEGQLVLSDPSATQASRASAGELVRAAGLAIGDPTSLTALRGAGLIDGCTAVAEQARRAAPAVSLLVWKRVPGICGPTRAESVAAFAVLARSAAPPTAHYWWGRVLESYAASVPWSSSLTQGTAADDVADAYLDMVDDDVQKLRADIEHLPSHPFVDVLVSRDASGVELHPGLARSVWKDVREVQARLQPVRNLDSLCGNAVVDQTVAVLLDGLTRALHQVHVPFFSQATSQYLQQLAKAQITLTAPPPMEVGLLPQVEERRVMEAALGQDAMSLYASALTRARDACPARVAPSRRGLAYLTQAFQDWSACRRLGFGDAQCTEGGLTWAQIGGSAPQDPLPLPTPVFPGG